MMAMGFILHALLRLPPQICANAPPTSSNAITTVLWYIFEIKLWAPMAYVNALKKIWRMKVAFKEKRILYRDNVIFKILNVHQQ